MTDKVSNALNYVHIGEGRDASREWAALDVLAAEVRRQREVIEDLEQRLSDAEASLAGM